MDIVMTLQESSIVITSLFKTVVGDIPSPHVFYRFKMMTIRTC